jgi:hypothetical protein
LCGAFQLAGAAHDGTLDIVFGMLTSLARAMAALRRGFAFRVAAAHAGGIDKLAPDEGEDAARFSTTLDLRFLIFAHLECPGHLIASPLSLASVKIVAYMGRVGNKRPALAALS